MKILDSRFYKDSRFQVLYRFLDPDSRFQSRSYRFYIDPWLQISGSKLQVPDSMYVYGSIQISGTRIQFQVLGSKFQVLGSKCQVLGSKFQVLGSKCQVTSLRGSRYQVPGFKF